MRKRVDRILRKTVAKLYSHIVKGDAEVLNVPPETNTHKYPVLRKGVETAVKSLKKGKSPGIDNIPGELVQAGEDAVVTITEQIFNLRYCMRGTLNINKAPITSLVIFKWRLTE